PSDEKPTGLLADALSPAERDALTRHVEGCAACQEQLAHLTEIADTERWRRAEHWSRGSRAENGLVWRLKRMRSRLALTGPTQAARPAGRSARKSVRPRRWTASRRPCPAMRSWGSWAAAVWASSTRPGSSASIAPWR